MYFVCVIRKNFKCIVGGFFGAMLSTFLRNAILGMQTSWHQE